MATKSIKVTLHDTNDKEEIKYNKVVNIAEDGEITVLDYVFKYRDSFKGATGSKFEPITESKLQEVISDYEGNDKELLIYFAENFGELNRQIIENLDSSREALIELFFDSSHSDLWDYLREEMGETDPTSENYPVLFNCIGGGRCFDAKFKGNKNPELSKIIRKYESK